MNHDKIRDVMDDGAAWADGAGVVESLLQRTMCMCIRNMFIFYKILQSFKDFVPT